ncbi:hypothetical protein C0992_003287 [Termitomyces sp. T32_za158]|nr:hypothetical protein C0992_003287 [Termitomyces sp. T32_za158]
MECNRNPRFVVQCTLHAGHKSGPGLPSHAPVARDAHYDPEVGQPRPKLIRDVLLRVVLPKATFGGGDAGYRPSSGATRCYNYGCMGHYLKDCKALRAQVQAAHTAAVGSNAGSNAEADWDEPVEDKEVLQEVKKQSVVDDAESV